MTSVIEKFEPSNSNDFCVEKSDTKNERKSNQKSNDNQNVSQVQTVVVSGSRSCFALILRSEMNKNNHCYV
jgi:hypothetical protein